MSYSDPPPPPNYGGQPPAYGGGMPGGPTRDHPRATLILVLGIVSIVCCGLFTGIPAIIMGRGALREIDAAPGTFRNRGTVKAGYICGIVGTVLSAIGILINIAILASGGEMMFSTSTS
jgi:hypothetical protein